MQERNDGSKDWRAHGPSVPASLETLHKGLASPWSCWVNLHLMKSPKFHPQQEGSGVFRLCLFLLSRTQIQQQPNPNPVPNLHLGVKCGGSWPRNWTKRVPGLRSLVYFPLEPPWLKDVLLRDPSSFLSSPFPLLSLPPLPPSLPPSSASPSLGPVPSCGKAACPFVRGPNVSERGVAPSPCAGARGFEKFIDFHPKGLITLLTVNSSPAVQ